MWNLVNLSPNASHFQALNGLVSSDTTDNNPNKLSLTQFEASDRKSKCFEPWEAPIPNLFSSRYRPLICSDTIFRDEVDQTSKIVLVCPIPMAWISREFLCENITISLGIKKVVHATKDLRHLSFDKSDICLFMLRIQKWWLKRAEI